MPDVLCLGNFVVDVIGKPVDRLPAAGELLLLDTLAAHVGGNAPNCALALACLGVIAAAAGRVGEDLYGRFLLAELADASVQTGPVARDADCRTGVTIVAVNQAGERSFLYYPGANSRFAASDVPTGALQGLRWLHVGSFFVLPAMEGAALAALLRQARQQGVRTSLDVCWDAAGRWMESLAPCLPEVDYFLPSETEAAMLAGTDSPPEMAAAFLARGVGAVVIKLGQQGCYASVAGETRYEPAFDVPVRDATGAGDCFVAGFLAGQLSGWPLPRALRFANACGALAVSSFGGAAGMRSLPEVEAWMESHRQRRPAEEAARA